MKDERRVALALGSNLGDRLAHLRMALVMIGESPGLSSVVVSDVYESLPVGGPPQPEFLNAVVRFDSSRAPIELLGLAQQCEAATGRVRVERWGPRTLDVDVLAIADVVSDDPLLTLPHPRALERAFVLLPWCDVDPEFVVSGKSVADWAAAVDSSGVVRADAQIAGVR